MESHLRTITTTKRSLAGLCAAMETSVATDRTGRPGEPQPIVLGLFQRPAYFEGARRRFCELAASGALCVVAFTGDVSHLPAGVQGVALGELEALSNEWSLVIFSGGFGASLVARDLGDIAPGEETFEAARLFSAHWSFTAARAAAEGRRIVDGLGTRLDPALRAQILQAARVAADVEPSEVEQRMADMSAVLVSRIDLATSRNSRLGAQVRRERDNAERDQLTGLFNRRYLERYLASPVERAPVGVAAVLIDLDGLKEINDTFGHTVGDAALAGVAKALRDVTRPQDVLVRLGGDEFLAVIPGQSSASGLLVAERIVERVGATRLPDPWGDVRITVSVGVSAAEPHRIPLKQLDAALYTAKRGGRGRACLLDVGGS